jgi:hypothetical protein
MRTSLSGNNIREAVEGAIRSVRGQPSLRDRARSQVSDIRDTVHEGSDRIRKGAREAADGATGASDDNRRRKIAATVGAVGAAGAAGAYLLRDKIAGGVGDEDRTVVTPAGQAPADSDSTNGDSA